MLIVKRGIFLVGAAMAVTFFGVLILMFLPLLGGRNTFQASDDLFNSIAKGSSNHFKDLRKEADEHQGATFELEMELKSADMVGKAVMQLSGAGMRVERKDLRMRLSGDLGSLAGAILDDSERLFHITGGESISRYGYPDRDVLFAWWSILKEMQRVLESQGRFEAAAFLRHIMTRGVEVAYNFYGIKPEEPSKRAGLLGGALVFYLLYTIWWGYAILYLFNGLGMGMKARSSPRKEI